MFLEAHLNWGGGNNAGRHPVAPARARAHRQLCAAATPEANAVSHTGRE